MVAVVANPRIAGGAEGSTAVAAPDGRDSGRLRPGPGRPACRAPGPQSPSHRRSRERPRQPGWDQHRGKSVQGGRRRGVGRRHDRHRHRLSAAARGLRALRHLRPADPAGSGRARPAHGADGLVSGKTGRGRAQSLRRHRAPLPHRGRGRPLRRVGMGPQRQRGLCLRPDGGDVRLALGRPRLWRRGARARRARPPRARAAGAAQFGPLRRLRRLLPGAGAGRRTRRLDRCARPGPGRPGQRLQPYHRRGAGRHRRALGPGPRAGGRTAAQGRHRERVWKPSPCGTGAIACCCPTRTSACGSTSIRAC